MNLIVPSSCQTRYTSQFGISPILRLKMEATQHLTSTSYDFIVVSGGTAGCVSASLLSEYLLEKSILLIEGGDTELENQGVQLMKQPYSRAT
jgi:hypothetical protein